MSPMMKIDPDGSGAAPDPPVSIVIDEGAVLTQGNEVLKRKIEVLDGWTSGEKFQIIDEGTATGLDISEEAEAVI